MVSNINLAEKNTAMQDKLSRNLFEKKWDNSGVSKQQKQREDKNHDTPLKDHLDMLNQLLSKSRFSPPEIISSFIDLSEKEKIKGMDNAKVSICRK